MADETSVAAGKRFSRDLRRIREDRDVSIDEVHKETRIARSLLTSFEEGGLYEHPTFNEVYLRSFVRAYAEAVGISPDTVRGELDSALEGTYEDALADEYLDSPPASREEDERAPSDDEASPPSPSDSALPEEETSQEDDSPDEPRESSRPEPPSAGGPEGRGGIVGPARAVGDESDEQADESARPIEEERDQPAGGSDSAGAEQDEPAPPDADREGTSDTSSPDHAQEDDSSSVETEDQSVHKEAEEAPSELPEDRPSWMEEGEEEDEETHPGSLEGEVGATGASDEGEPSPPAGGPEGSGIVGEPKALGGEAEDPPAPGGTSPARPTSPPRRTRRRSTWSKLFQGEWREMVWAGVGFVVVLLVLVGLGVAFFSSSTETTQGQASSRSTPTAADTATASASADTTASTSASRPPPANVTLGPSIPLTVLAFDNVRGIRIKRDEDLERPYWIEDGDAAVFPFENRVTLRYELEDVQLFLAGYPYPQSRWDTTGLVEITRDEVESFVDTLRGPPATLSTTLDTIPKGPPNQ